MDHQRYRNVGQPVGDAIARLLDAQDERLQSIEERQEQIQRTLGDLSGLMAELRDRSALTLVKQEWFTPAEVAVMLGKRPYTVREWCRLQRINARKRQTGRGDAVEWEVSGEEIERYKNHGLLPIPTHR